MNRLAIFFIILLTGCQTYYTNPDRKMVIIEGTEVSIVKRTPTEFDAFVKGSDTYTNIAILKGRQIKAIEQLSACKVTAAEYKPGTWILQSIVSCESK